MPRRKIVSFNYFKVCRQDEQGEHVYLRLRELFDHIINNYQTARENDQQGYMYNYEYHNEPIRLTNIDYDYNNGFYHLIFDRLDPLLPNVATLEGESRILDIEENEYIGHEISALYDPERHALVLQRNISSLSPTAVELFLRTLIVEMEIAETFELITAVDGEANQRAFNQNSYDAINLKVSGDRSSDLFRRFFERRNNGVHQIEINIKAEQGRENELDQEVAREILNEYVEGEGVEKLNIKGRENDDDNLEKIDLIRHKITSQKSYRFENQRTLNALNVFQDMVTLYTEGDRPIINRI